MRLYLVDQLWRAISFSFLYFYLNFSFAKAISTLLWHSAAVASVWYLQYTARWECRLAKWKFRCGFNLCICSFALLKGPSGIMTQFRLFRQCTYVTHVFMYFQMFTEELYFDVLLFIESFRQIYESKRNLGFEALQGLLAWREGYTSFRRERAAGTALSEWKRCWSKLLSLVLECNVFETFWNRILLHWHLCCCQGQGLHAARLTFCKTRCRYQRSVMFTCLLGSSAFIAIQNDPNPLYNTVYFNLCVCFVWPWIQFDWNGRSQWMQSFWELTTQIWVWFILGAGHQPFWIVTN